MSYWLRYLWHRVRLHQAYYHRRTRGRVWSPAYGACNTCDVDFR